MPSSPPPDSIENPPFSAPAVMNSTAPTTPHRQAAPDMPSPQGSPHPANAAITTSGKHGASSPASPGRAKMRGNAAGSRIPVATNASATTTEPEDTIMAGTSPPGAVDHPRREEAADVYRRLAAGMCALRELQAQLDELCLNRTR